VCRRQKLHKFFPPEKKGKTYLKVGRGFLGGAKYRSEVGGKKVLKKRLRNTKDTEVLSKGIQRLITKLGGERKGRAADGKGVAWKRGRKEEII